MEGGAVATAPILAAEGADDMRRTGDPGGAGAIASRRADDEHAGGAIAAVKAVRVASGLASPVGFTFTPSGRLVYVERNTGWLRFRSLRSGFSRRVHRIQSVNFDGERGALGVDLHPSWPTQPFVYVFVTRNTAGGSPQPGPPDQGAERSRGGCSDDPVGRRRPREQPQRRSHPLRTRQQALRRDR